MGKAANAVSAAKAADVNVLTLEATKEIADSIYTGYSNNSRFARLLVDGQIDPKHGYMCMVKNRPEAIWKRIEQSIRMGVRNYAEELIKAGKLDATMTVTMRVDKETESFFIETKKGNASGQGRKESSGAQSASTKLLSTKNIEQAAQASKEGHVNTPNLVTATTVLCERLDAILTSAPTLTVANDCARLVMEVLKKHNLSNPVDRLPARA